MLGSCVRSAKLFEAQDTAIHPGHRPRKPFWNPSCPAQKKPRREEDQAHANLGGVGLLRGAREANGKATGLKGVSPTNSVINTGDVVIYGNETDLFGDDDVPSEEEIPDNPVDPNVQEKHYTTAVSQTMIDSAVAEKRVGAYYEIIKGLQTNPETGKARTRLSTVLTYHSTNTFTGEDLEDLDADGSQDIVGSGLWIGIARLILTPLTLGFDVVKGNGSKMFSSTTPFLVKVLGITFGAKETTYESDSAVTIGPYTDGQSGLVCNVAYIPAEDIVGEERVQDAGDSFLTVYKGLDPQGKQKWFCGTGLTTRTQKGYSSNKDEPLYEAGLCEQNSMSGPNAAVSIVVPEATHEIELDGVSVEAKTPGAIPTNRYTVRAIDAGEKVSVTGKQAAQFQEQQSKSTEAGSPKPTIPCWGGVQVQLPRAAVKGILRAGIKEQGKTVARIGMLNINLQILVTTAVD